mgnify:CR=1 FL=1
MARIVMKFGGTSMAGTERIRRVANIVRAQAAPKPDGTRDSVVVVVSAMAGETDRLVNFCREANPLYDPAEYDVVVASGEQVTSGLLALTLQALGCKARSWLGWQLPIQTIEAHAKARVGSIDSQELLASMKAGNIAVIPGFQGLTDDNRITTLGRGGSDTSAVAVAAVGFVIIIHIAGGAESAARARVGTCAGRIGRLPTRAVQVVLRGEGFFVHMGRRAALARTRRLTLLATASGKSAGEAVAEADAVVARGVAVALRDARFMQTLLAVELRDVVAQGQHLLEGLELQLRVVLGHLAEDLAQHLGVLARALALLQQLLDLRN